MTQLSVQAVEPLADGQTGKAVGVLQDEINIVNLVQACKMPEKHIGEYLRIWELLK